MKAERICRIGLLLNGIRVLSQESEYAERISNKIKEIEDEIMAEIKESEDDNK